MGRDQGIFEGILLGKSVGKPKEILRKSNENDRGYPRRNATNLPKISGLFYSPAQGFPRKTTKNLKKQGPGPGDFEGSLLGNR